MKRQLALIGYMFFGIGTLILLWVLAMSSIHGPPPIFPIFWEGQPTIFTYMIGAFLVGIVFLILSTGLDKNEVREK